MSSATGTVIETHYDGRHFRSRTEARWAVFFNAMRWQYEYEKEGFELPCGRYLPDFFLPDLNVWVEVKGQQPTDEEMTKCSFLFWHTQVPCLLTIGGPSTRPNLFHVPLLMTEEEGMRGSGTADRRLFFATDTDGTVAVASPDGICHVVGRVKHPLSTFAAVRAALSARFEARAA